jgi:hypothetical protein
LVVGSIEGERTTPPRAAQSSAHAAADVLLDEGVLGVLGVVGVLGVLGVEPPGEPEPPSDEPDPDDPDPDEPVSGFLFPAEE